MLIQVSPLKTKIDQQLELKMQETKKVRGEKIKVINQTENSGKEDLKKRTGNRKEKGKKMKKKVLSGTTKIPILTLLRAAVWA